MKGIEKRELRKAILPVALGYITQCSMSQLTMCWSSLVNTRKLFWKFLLRLSPLCLDTKVVRAVTLCAKRTQKERKEKEKKKEKERRQKSLYLHRAGEFYKRTQKERKEKEKKKEKERRQKSLYLHRAGIEIHAAAL